jgi:hypothetical protein
LAGLPECGPGKGKPFTAGGVCPGPRRVAVTKLPENGKVEQPLTGPEAQWIAGTAIHEQAAETLAAHLFGLPDIL